ncbi:hypothetical protein N1851_016589 [Merluccius polli]|uniref:Uncharacterized protein n=1 Tax=Merluccius polli TaxID=89951 RepID=A0AA47MQW3_MERPO|nr:hypothetical protein N1851_016589 [Merluccius polli]
MALCGIERRGRDSTEETGCWLVEGRGPAHGARVWVRRERALLEWEGWIRLQRDCTVKHCSTSSSSAFTLLSSTNRSPFAPSSAFPPLLLHHPLPFAPSSERHDGSSQDGGPGALVRPHIDCALGGRPHCPSTQLPTLRSNEPSFVFAESRNNAV